jgi:hypothetical protein
MKGGEAQILSIAVDKISLSSTQPAPPGARVEGEVSSVRLRIKVHACKKQPDGRFLIEGRPLDLSRADLDRIDPH